MSQDNVREEFEKWYEIMPIDETLEMAAWLAWQAAYAAMLSAATKEQK